LELLLTKGEIMNNASDMLPNPDWSEFSGVVSGESQTTGYVAIYTFWDDVTILCCGFDEALVEKKAYEIAEKRNLRKYKLNIDVIEVEST
jgi:hypothetical protein